MKKNRAKKKKVEEEISQPVVHEVEKVEEEIKPTPVISKKEEKISEIFEMTGENIPDEPHLQRMNVVKSWGAKKKKY